MCVCVWVRGPSIPLGSLAMDDKSLRPNATTPSVYVPRREGRIRRNGQEVLSSFWTALGGASIDHLYRAICVFDPHSQRHVITTPMEVVLLIKHYGWQRLRLLIELEDMEMPVPPFESGPLHDVSVTAAVILTAIIRLGLLQGLRQAFVAALLKGWRPQLLDMASCCLQRCVRLLLFTGTLTARLRGGSSGIYCPERRVNPRPADVAAPCSLCTCATPWSERAHLTAAPLPTPLHAGGLPAHVPSVRLPSSPSLSCPLSSPLCVVFCPCACACPRLLCVCVCVRARSRLWPLARFPLSPALLASLLSLCLFLCPALFCLFLCPALFSSVFLCSPRLSAACPPLH